MIHLVVPADEPAALCGLGRSWGAPVSWRYPKDLAEVTCTACLLRFEARLIAEAAAVELIDRSGSRLDP